MLDLTVVGLQVSTYFKYRPYFRVQDIGRWTYKHINVVLYWDPHLPKMVWKLRTLNPYTPRYDIKYQLKCIFYFSSNTQEPWRQEARWAQAPWLRPPWENRRWWRLPQRAGAPRASQRQPPWEELQPKPEQEQEWQPREEQGQGAQRRQRWESPAPSRQQHRKELGTVELCVGDEHCDA